MSAAQAQIGVIGGSGFYSFLSGARRVPVSTPFGEPSDDLVVGELHGRSVAFLARHGHDHRFPPHQINYRANLWALRSVGVRQVLAPCAVGSLRPELGPGTVVVPDQVIDRTWGRAHTVYEQVGKVVHVGFADPYARPAAAPSPLRSSIPVCRMRSAAPSSWSTARASPAGPRASGTSRPGGASWG